MARPHFAGAFFIHGGMNLQDFHSYKDVLHMQSQLGKFHQDLTADQTAQTLTKVKEHMNNITSCLGISFNKKISSDHFTHQPHETMELFLCVCFVGGSVEKSSHGCKVVFRCL